MREIKFRAWLKDESRMYGWCSEFFSDTSPVTAYGSDFPNSDNDEVILMQYTGLKDKNGKDIFEGDVVQDGVRVGLVEYDAPEFSAIEIRHKTESECQGCLNVLLFPNECEVIGNLYENQELLTNK